MNEVSDVRRAFEDSLRKIDELIEGMRAERDRIKAEFERRLELVRFGLVDWARFEEFFEEPYVIVPKRPNEWYVIAPKWLNFQRACLFLNWPKLAFILLLEFRDSLKFRACPCLP